MIVLPRSHFGSESVLTADRETYRRIRGHRDGINFFDYRQSFTLDPSTRAMGLPSRWMNISLAREVSPEDVARVLRPDAVKQTARNPRRHQNGTSRERLSA